MSEMATKPEREFKVGGVRATVWANPRTDGKGEAYSSHRVILERVYRDSQGGWKTTGSLGPEDLPKAILALRQAYEHIVLNKRRSDTPPAGAPEPVPFEWPARIP